MLFKKKFEPFQVMKDCLDIVRNCFSSDEIKIHEDEVKQGAVELRQFWEPLTQQLEVELPDLKPCFKIKSGQAKIIPALAPLLAIAALKMLIS
jgi:hypothetical protein